MKTIVFNNPQAHHVYFWLTEASNFDITDLLEKMLALVESEESLKSDSEREYDLVEPLAEVLEEHMSEYLCRFGLSNPIDVPLGYYSDDWESLDPEARTLLVPLLADCFLGISYYPIAEALLAKHNEWYEDALKKLTQRSHISVNS